jgi:hypothetical protein
VFSVKLFLGPIGDFLRTHCGIARRLAAIAPLTLPRRIVKLHTR